MCTMMIVAAFVAGGMCGMLLMALAAMGSDN